MNRWLRLSMLCACIGIPMTGLSEEAPETAEETAQSLRCVSLHRIKTTRVLDDRTIVFEMSGKQTLVNNLPRRCPGLGFEKSFGYKTSLSQLCSHDTIWVISDIGRGASCGLGAFVPYVAPEQSTERDDKGKLEPVVD